MVRGDRPANSILLVEDNEVEREGLATILRRHGYAVREADSGVQALAALRAELPDLMLLDMLLPESDGWSVLDQVRRVPEWAALPVIIITGLSVASFEWSLSLGALDVVRKPIDSEELLRKIKRYIH